MKKTLALLCALAAGCGTGFSNEELRMIKALPDREVSFMVPEESGATQGLGSCEHDRMIARLRRSAADLNAGIRGAIGLIEGIVKNPPTRREGTARIWGPVDLRAENITVRLTMDRQETLFAFRLEVGPLRARSDAEFTLFIDGETGGPGGDGAMDVHFDDVRALGLAKAVPIGEAIFTWERSAGEIALTATLLPSSVVNGDLLGDFNYRHLRRTDGSGEMCFAFPLAAATDMESCARWTAEHAGRLDAKILRGDTTRFVTECWDRETQESYFQSNMVVLCGIGNTPCACGAPAACPFAEPLEP
jgi:hypothetical protein